MKTDILLSSLKKLNHSGLSMSKSIMFYIHFYSCNYNLLLEKSKNSELSFKPFFDMKYNFHFKYFQGSYFIYKNMA
jgi:hypothetical protein